jgi:hypothetical protein
MFDSRIWLWVLSFVDFRVAFISLGIAVPWLLN